MWAAVLTWRPRVSYRTAMVSWNRDRLSRLACSLATAALTGLVVPYHAMAAEAPQHADVSVNERGFDPVGVTIGLGGSVTWINTGTTGHDVSTGSAPISIE